MMIRDHGQRLKAFREVAGLSQRALAREIGEQYSNVRYWETSGKLPRSDVLVPIARTLGVTVEELLGEPKPSRPAAPRGRAQAVFDQINKLPRRQQAKVLDTIETLLAGQIAREEATEVKA